MAKLKRQARAAQAMPAPYAGCRRQFRSGDLIAQSHGDWNSWAGIQVIGVRAFTLSTFSHVGVIHVDPMDGRVYVIEAVRPVVHRVYLSTIGSFYHLPLPAVWTDGTTEFADAQMGTEYSRWDAIEAYFIELPAGTVSQCAALAREVLLRAGVDLGKRSRPDALVARALAMRSAMTWIENGGNK
jgi:hypothetical protein